MILHAVVNHEGVTDAEIEHIFDPEDGTEDIVRSDASCMEELAVQAGIFPSKGQARKNGFCGPIPHGVECFGIKKKWLWVWNPLSNEEAIVLKKGFVQTWRFCEEINKD